MKFFSMLIFYVISIFFSLIIFHKNGFPSRIDPPILNVLKSQYAINPQREKCFAPAKRLILAECLMGNENIIPEVAVWGDSHSDSMFEGLDSAFKRMGSSAVYYGLSACSPARIKDLSARVKRCRDFNERVLQRIEYLNLKRVILISKWSSDFYGGHGFDFESMACKLHQKGLHVSVILSVPKFEYNLPRYMAYKMHQEGRAINSFYEVSVQTAQQMSKINKEKLLFGGSGCVDEFIDPTPIYCNGESCSPLVDGVLMYYDDNHMNSFGSRLFGDYVLQKYPNLLIN